MFCIIDRYLLRQFVSVLIICFFSLAGLYIVVDAFGHLDHFVDHADGRGSVLGILAEYYAYQTLGFFDRMSGILALVAAMFTVTWIQRHHEMTALMAAGIPRLRILRPVIAAALLLSLAAAANREIVIPSVRHKLALDSKNLGGEKQVDLQSRFDSQTDILIAGKNVVSKERMIVRPNFVLPTELDEYGKQLLAERTIHIPAQPGRKAGYLLDKVTAPTTLLEQSSLALDGRPVVITPRDANWLAPDQLFVVSGVSFEFLASGATWRDFASTRELVRELNSPSTDLGADVRVAVHSRVTRPLLDATLLLLGLPLVISRTNRNPFVAIGLCVAIVACFMVVVLGCQSLGSGGWMRPALAAWLPLMIFAPLAAALSVSFRQ